MPIQPKRYYALLSGKTIGYKQIYFQSSSHRKDAEHIATNFGFNFQDLNFKPGGNSQFYENPDQFRAYCSKERHGNQ